MDWKKKIIPIIFLLPLNCVYTTSSYIPSHLRTIAIPTFESSVFQYGIREELTSLLIKAFSEDNHLRITEEKKADSILKGKVVRYEKEPFQYSPQEVVTQ